MWIVPNILLILYSLLFSICLLKSHEISLVLTTRHSVIDSQTIIFSSHLALKLQVQISTAPGELPTGSNLTLNIT